MQAFSGDGQRLDGRTNKNNVSLLASSTEKVKRGLPNYKYKKGKLTFVPKSLMSGQQPEPMASKRQQTLSFLVIKFICNIKLLHYWASGFL